jgi:hypothetical protein
MKNLQGLYLISVAWHDSEAIVLSVHRRSLLNFVKDIIQWWCCFTFKDLSLLFGAYYSWGETLQGDGTVTDCAAGMMPYDR